MVDECGLHRGRGVVLGYALVLEQAPAQCRIDLAQAMGAVRKSVE